MRDGSANSSGDNIHVPKERLLTEVEHVANKSRHRPQMTKMEVTLAKKLVEKVCA